MINMFFPSPEKLHLAARNDTSPTVFDLDG